MCLGVVRAVLIAVFIAASAGCNTGGRDRRTRRDRNRSIHPIAVRDGSIAKHAGILRVRIRNLQGAPALASLVGLRPGDKISGVLSRSDGMLHRVRRIETIRDLQRQL